MMSRVPAQADAPPPRLAASAAETELDSDADAGQRVTPAQAEEWLDGLPLVPAMAGSIPEMKALRERCLAAGIPALVGCPPGAGKG
jgi:hypothetical protein